MPVATKSRSAKQRISHWTAGLLGTAVAATTGAVFAFAAPPTGPVEIDFSYCGSHGRTVVVVAHADDDRYFFGDEIRKRLKAGNCIKVIHVNAGFDVKPESAANWDPSDPWFYQGRIDGAKAVYEAMLQNEHGGTPVTTTNSWDTINGFSVNRYVISSAMNGGRPAGQLVEIQILGLPNSSNGGPTSSAGTTTSALYADATATASNVAPYNLGSAYHWSDIQAIIDTVIGWANPSEVLTLDPYGLPGDDGHQGQHPDHIIAARLVLNSTYAKNHPTQISYFKTYSVNDLGANLSDAIAADSKAELQIHWLYDWGSSWIASASCSQMAKSRQALHSPYGWICKKYKAEPAEYFEGALLANASGKCLNADNVGALSFGTCSSTSLPISIGRSGLAWVSNTATAGAKMALPNTTLTQNSQLKLIGFEAAMAERDGARGTRWRYDVPTSALVLHYTDAVSGDYRSSCLGMNGSNQAVLVDCTSNSKAALTPKPDSAKALPTTGSKRVQLQHANSNQCLSLGASVTLTTCGANGTALELQADGRITSSDGGSCLNSPTFGTQGNRLRSTTCRAGHPGQRFALEQIGSSDRYTLQPALDHVCAEGDLALYDCHTYDQQLWRVLPRP